MVCSGRLFLRRLIDLSITACKLHHHITLNAEARKDIQWWLDFLPTWNGISIFPDDNWTPASDLLTFTDASSKIGNEAYCKKDWFCGAWPSHLQGQCIQWKELFTIYLACDVWGRSAQSSKSKDLMDLAGKIFLISVTHNFLVKFQHVPGSNNPIADFYLVYRCKSFENWPQTQSQIQQLSRNTCFDFNVSTLMSRLKAFKKATLAPSTSYLQHWYYKILYVLREL